MLQAIGTARHCARLVSIGVLQVPGIDLGLGDTRIPAKRRLDELMQEDRELGSLIRHP